MRTSEKTTAPPRDSRRVGGLTGQRVTRRCRRFEAGAERQAEIPKKFVGVACFGFSFGGREGKDDGAAGGAAAERQKANERANATEKDATTTFRGTCRIPLLVSALRG